MTVRHESRDVDFRWAPRSGDAIQWAAFYSDCEHEIMTVSSGERITLTYDLYVTELEGASSPLDEDVDPRTLPVYGLLKSTLSEPEFMTNGIVLPRSRRS